jgi:hypothetical protein
MGCNLQKVCFFSIPVVLIQKMCIEYFRHVLLSLLMIIYLFTYHVFMIRDNH